MKKKVKARKSKTSSEVQDYVPRKSQKPWEDEQVQPVKNLFGSTIGRRKVKVKGQQSPVLQMKVAAAEKRAKSKYGKGDEEINRKLRGPKKISQALSR